MIASGSMARLRPVPEHAGACPRCARPLIVRRLHLPGWRTLVEGRCSECGHTYVQDLPAGHAVTAPATLDLETGEVIDPTGTTWFASWLHRGWTSPSDDAVTLTIDGPGASGPAVLLNCLDPIYGHSLLKLLNAQRHLDHGQHDLVVLVPHALRHLVPDRVSEIWVLEGPPSVAWRWLLALDHRIAAELDRLGDALLSTAFPHPHPSTWDLERFTGPLQARRDGEPSFVFALRDDRRWGLSAAHQRANVAATWKALRRRFPSAGATLIGIGQPGWAPAGVGDLRVQRPTLADERAWMEAAAGADLVIGMHGSHLLLPSGLASMTLELTPADRYGNVVQASLVRDADPLLALWRYRQLPGGRHLADLLPWRVAAVAAEMVTGRDRFAALMTGPNAGIGDAPTTTLTADQPRPVFAPRAQAAQLAGRGRNAVGAAVRAMRGRRLTARAPSPPVVLTDRRGLRFELLTDEEIGAFLRHGGHFEGDELDYLAGLSLSGDAIDVGANIGVFTALLGRAVGPTGQVHAFEPLPTVRKRLQRTLELNRLENVTVHGAAVADAAGTDQLAFYGPGYESWTSLTRGAIELPGRTLAPTERLSIATTTLDAFCEATDIDRVAVLKVDVEGAEGRVLRGAQQLFAERRVELLLLELSDETLRTDGWSSAQVVGLLDDHGYDTWELRDGRLQRFRPAGLIAFANVVAMPRAA